MERWGLCPYFLTLDGLPGLQPKCTEAGSLADLCSVAELNPLGLLLSVKLVREALSSQDGGKDLKGGMGEACGARPGFMSLALGVLAPQAGPPHLLWVPWPTFTHTPFFSLPCMQCSHTHTHTFSYTEVQQISTEHVRGLG